MIAIKKSITLTFPFALMLTGCVEDVPAEDNDNVNTEISTRAFGQEGDLFYYYFDEKIYLTQRTDQVFVKFSPDATEEQFLNVAKNNAETEAAETTQDNQAIR